MIVEARASYRNKSSLLNCQQQKNHVNVSNSKSTSIGKKITVGIWWFYLVARTVEARS